VDGPGAFVAGRGLAGGERRPVRGVGVVRARGRWSGWPVGGLGAGEGRGVDAAFRVEPVDAALVVVCADVPRARQARLVAVEGAFDSRFYVVLRDER